MGLFNEEPTTTKIEGFTLHKKSLYVLLDSESDGADKFKRDYYKILSVPRDATTKEIKKAYYEVHCWSRGMISDFIF